MKVTLKDIANEANVSVATVSLVLNNKDGRIPEETRTMIKKIAKDLNYVPNYSARSLVMQKSNSIGLIIPDLINPYFSTLAKTAVHEFRKKGYVCIILDSDGLFEKDMELLDYLKERNVDGILYTMSNESYKYLDDVKAKINDLGLPIVFMDRNIDGYPSVTFDNIYGGYVATNSLLEKGYTEVGMITGPLYSKSGEARYLGYQKALKRKGIQFNKSLIVEGDYDFEAGFNNADFFIDKNIKAIVAANDMAAFGYIKRAKQRGLYAGHDYSIVGYDNVDLTEVIDIPLTSVYQDIEDLTTTGVEMLLSIMKDEDIVDFKLLKPSLVIRDSIVKVKE